MTSRTWRLLGLLSLAACSAAAGMGHADRAIFAGGCFWCMESDVEKVAGVTAVISGYTGGHTPNPDYERVSEGNTGHYEAVEVHFDPSLISYRQLLDIYWVNIDPLDSRGQFCDKGSSYRSALFPIDAQQRAAAEQSKRQAQERLGADHRIATVIVDATAFYPAEEYHQDYYLKNPRRYHYYRWSCGRDQRLKELWGSG